MRVDFQASGVDGLERRLNQLPSAVSRRVQIKALKSGAEPIRGMAASLAPRDEEASAPHLADHIIVAELSAKQRDAESLFDSAAVEVGPAAPFFYGFFQEVGTAFHPAKPFLRPAFDSMKGRSLNIVRSALWAEIRKRLGLGGGVSGTGGNL